MTVLLVIVGVSACGGKSSSGVVAEVGSDQITKASVNHWMATLAGGDYYQLSHKHTVPAGLVSEPPNYPRCVSQLEVAAANAPIKRAPQTGVQLLQKCRQLYQALRTQAVAFLVNSQWLVNLAREEGVTASDAEVRKLYSEIKAREFPKQAELERFMAARRLSVADELSIVRLDVLAQKIEKKLTSGGKRALAKFTQAGKRWTAKASCKPGYVVEHCKQYVPHPTPLTQSASVLMEQVAATATGVCVNVEACGKQ